MWFGGPVGVRAYRLSGSDGSVVWQRELWKGNALDATVDSSGALIAAGSIDGGATWCDTVVAKLDASTGAEIWRAVFAEPGCERATSVVVDPWSDVLVAQGASPFETVKLSGVDGTRLWSHLIANPGVCLGGGCAAAQVVRVARISRDGTERWSRIIDYQGCGDGANLAALDGGSALAVGGWVFAMVAGVCAWPQGGMRMILTLDPDTGEDLPAPPVFCGDSLVQPNEECDDDNSASGDGCSAGCSVESDGDVDGVPDVSDNCPFVSNPAQSNTDLIGDACDPFPVDSDHDQSQCELDLGSCVDTGAACAVERTQCEDSLGAVSAELEQCLSIPEGDHQP